MAYDWPVTVNMSRFMRQAGLADKTLMREGPSVLRPIVSRKVAGHDGLIGVSKVRPKGDAKAKKVENKDYRLPTIFDNKVAQPVFILQIAVITYEAKALL